MGEYDIMQVCLQGHKITEYYSSQPEHRQNYCEQCGSETITSCQECGADIRGNYDVEGAAVVGSETDVPSYCHDCGEPYPWMG
jgi:hypothetical protein